MSPISPFVHTLILLRSELTLVPSLHICAVYPGKLSVPSENSGKLTSSSCWLGRAGETDFISKCEFPLVIKVLTKGITADHENWIEQHSKQDSYLIQRYYSQLLRYNKNALTAAYTSRLFGD